MGWDVRASVCDHQIKLMRGGDGMAGMISIIYIIIYIHILVSRTHNMQDRIRLEAMALTEESRCCPEYVPRVLLYDGPKVSRGPKLSQWGWEG